jgi:guanylate kinase
VEKTAEGKLVVITGPSGVGKSTIVERVLDRTGARYSVSATTRQPRPGEEDGRSYHFVDRRTFRDMVDRGQMLEWAEVHGECYGTPAGGVRKAIESGHTIVLDIDVQGAMQVYEKHPDAVFVFVLPPDQRELERRLRLRASEDERRIRARLDAAGKEVAAARKSGIFHHFVVNDDLESATRQVVDAVK